MGARLFGRRLHPAHARREFQRAEFAIPVADQRIATDLLVNDDRAVTLLEKLGKIRVLADARTKTGSIAACGVYPLLCLYAM